MLGLGFIPTNGPPSLVRSHSPGKGKKCVRRRPFRRHRLAVASDARQTGLLGSIGNALCRLHILHSRATVTPRLWDQPTPVLDDRQKRAIFGPPRPAAKGRFPPIAKGRKRPKADVGKLPLSASSRLSSLQVRSPRSTYLIFERKCATTFLYPLRTHQEMTCKYIALIWICGASRPIH
jgi:hypothetical protein